MKLMNNGLLYLLASIVVLAGCATSGPSNGTGPTGATPSRVTGSAPTHTSVRALQKCFSDAIRGSGATGLTVMIGSIESEATFGPYVRGLPQPLFTTYVTSIVREMGFTPIHPEADLAGQRTALKKMLEPDLVIRGGITGFDTLVSRAREALDGGIMFGNGGGLTNLSGSKEATVSIGTVTATVNIESPAKRGKEGAIWYPVTATASSTAEFKMSQSLRQVNGSILIGIGGGFASESVNVVDVQSAALFAVRMATILAISDQLKVNSPVCQS